MYPRCKLKLNLEISPLLKIGVEVYLFLFLFNQTKFYSKISQQNLPTLKKYSMMSKFEKDEKTNGIEFAKKYFR